MHKRRARLPSAPDAGYRRRRKLTSKGVFTCERLECGRDLPPPRHPELLAKDIAMRLRSSRRDAEPLSDLFVRAAQRDQLDHLALPLGQRDIRSVGGASHGRDATPRVPRQPSVDRSIRAVLDPSRAELPAYEARVVPAGIRLGELVRRQRLDPQQQIQFVT